MLREHELAALGEPGTYDREFSYRRIEITDTLFGEHAEHAKVVRCVLKNVRHKSKYRPPISRCARCCAGFSNRVTIAKECVVELQNVCGRLSPAYLP